MGVPYLSLVKAQFGIESSFGTNAAATRMFINIQSGVLEPVQEFSTTGIQGMKYGVRRTLIKESAKFSAKCILDYIDFGYMLSSIEGAPTEGAYSPGGTPVSGVYQHVWESSAYNADAFQSYTIEQPGSSADRVQKANGFVFSSYKIGTAKDKACTLDVTGYSKAIIDAISGTPVTASTGQNDVQTATVSGTPTSMTIILVSDNIQSSAISYTATTTAASWQTALRTLGGNWASATVSGSAGGPYTMTSPTGLPLETLSVLVSAIVGGSSPGCTIAHTTVGGMKMNQSYEVQPGDISIGWSTSLAGLDGAPTTPINQFKTDLEVSERHQLYWRQNTSDVGAAGIVEKNAEGQKHVQSFMLAYTSEVAAFIADSQATSLVGLYFRVMFTGPLIASSGVNRSLAFDYYCAINWKSANADAGENIRSCEFDLENLFDLNGIFVRRVTAINELTSYATA